jgi:predicted metal-binding membrane protein
MATARRVRERDGGLIAVAALPALAAAAWALSVARMSGMDAGPGADLGASGWFALTWLAMMAAMMLPSLVPAARASRAAAAFAGGYLGVWTAVGAAAYAAVEAVRAAEPGWLGWDRAGRWVAAGVVLAAAAYQLTAAKGACLDRCRAAADDRRADAGDALRRGLRHGASCVGCCAGLIAAQFALGAMSLTWMVAVAALIAAERLLPWRSPALHGVAAALAVLALWMAVAPGDLPGLTLPGSMGGM